MAGFNFERDLPHQTAAVEAIVQAFDAIGYTVPKDNPLQNNVIKFSSNLNQLKNNLISLQKANEITPSIQVKNSEDLIFDISMETGTGKTYTYTKTIFELNKEYGLFKFIIAVPRVAIKAGTVGFLTSEAAREHFKYEFGKTLKVYEVQSTKKNKGKKERLPQPIVDFCMADVRSSPNTIHVLVINSGMINSPTLEKQFDVNLLDRFSIAHEAIAYTRPVLIIDEPHLFKTDNKTFENLRRFKPQFTLRYGATFDNDFKNLVYQLNAIHAFNQDLVKGIVTHVETSEEASHTSVKLVGLDSEAHFELSMKGLDNKLLTKKFKLSKKDSLEKIRPEMKDLEISEFNKSKLILSNGLELRKGDSINPFSYAETLQNKMIQQTIVRHFQIEKELLSQRPRIKPLTLFFIDNIDSYRDKEGAMRIYFEQALKAHIQSLLVKETDPIYKQHLETALKNISGLHAGYFSKDNSDKDEAIEQETLEILHDKESLLSLDNPRRFIFSKWTLREGWDNPNIFQICKLRSSGSDTSKLQEVGRGLRLPVNEYMSRDKTKTYDLHYYVDFTEQDFVQKLKDEINQKSGAGFDEVKLDRLTIEAILNAYPDEFNHDDEILLETLGNAGIIKRNNDFKEQGFAKLKAQYPKAFKESLKAGKIKTGDKIKAKTTIRQGQYTELKALWESINQKVVLEYELNEIDFKNLFKQYLLDHKNQFIPSGSMNVQQRLIIENNQVSSRIEESANEPILPFKMMGYKAFLTKLSIELALGINTLHEAFVALLNDGELDINPYMSLAMIRIIKKGFNDYLMRHVFGQFKINYRKTSNLIHPTKFTNAQGQVESSIDSADIGTYTCEGTPPEKYLFNEYFYDSDLELDNIKNPPQEIVVYTKIPKNSIRIPLVGGGTYSPDFAYVIKHAEGNSELNLIVESKNKIESDLADNETQKINHAERFFDQLSGSVKISFKKQLENQTIVQLIRNAIMGK